MVRHWIIVPRHDTALFEALAAAFWNRKGFSVVLDRRTGASCRRAVRRTLRSDRRIAAPLDFGAERFCLTDARGNLAADLEMRFSR